MSETKVVVYKNVRSMQHGIKKMEKDGWEVVSVTAVEQGWAKGKTCLLGCLFLPLALLGRKPAVHQVIFKKVTDTSNK